MIRRGMALLVVLFALAVATLVVVGLQATAFRQAAAGRETVARVRAYWAARAGLESMLARLERNMDAGSTGSAFTDLDDMDAVAYGSIEGASWSIVHDEAGEERDGPADGHAKININRMSREDLMTLDGMTDEMADSILDWIDEDDSPNALGAEEGYYSQLPSPYPPRNGFIRSIQELELVAGVTPDLLRGEDWNLNGRLDANEDDGDASLPSDNADGVLDPGWSEFITAASLEPGVSSDAGAEPKLDLKEAATEELLARISRLDAGQALVILDYASRNQARVEDLINTRLSQIAQQGAGLPSTVRELTDDQIAEVLDKATIDDVEGEPIPGRVNINTVSRETLDYITALPPALADALILARDSTNTGFVTLMDLLEVPSMTRNRLARLSFYINVESNAFIVTSRGRDAATGIESEIMATIERTRLPAPLTEVRIR